ncbi:putative rho GTPase activator [Blumeria hordei DH14]|uniref:Putative rho GTPase activator n=1 Tax=Blumeria graminis f. sp. hordei (strain DH14) TaxID=546991 RepID=N1J6T3_BLUG1|nr:putative rho GTPase activator [Blumeria hordei DH14]
MGRKSISPQPLNLPDPKSISDHLHFLDSARSAGSPVSPTSKLSGTRSPFKFNSKKAQAQTLPATENTQSSKQAPDIPPSSVTLPFHQPAVSQQTPPNEPAEVEKPERRERASRSSFFNNYKASRSSNRLQSEKTFVASAASVSKVAERTVPGSHVSSNKEHPQTDSTIASSETRSDSPPPLTASSNVSKKVKSKSFSILSRSYSLRDDPSSIDPSLIDIIMEPEKSSLQLESVLTPPIEQDRSYRARMASNIRQHSAERLPSFQRERSKEQKNRTTKDSYGKSQIVTNLQKEQNRNPSSLSSSTGSNTFLNSLKSQATKGAGALSKGLFGKGSRNGNVANEKSPEVDDEHYELKVINLPLIQQTRLTRISKKLEDSKDKTEFWMPAFPWRAIDYLNYKGSDVEGLYRVPGSGPEIKKWRRRFDQELDIDLFEQSDLYDINIIGSMLKAWLRELPDELLPKTAQDRIARECANSEKVPQLLIDELSNLSPFNYYLLFAITCHLSLLLAHSEKNKMDYRNLCICFQPCMKIDAVCFKFLVCDWRDCWKGCKTEPFYVEQEYMLFDQMQSSHVSTESRSSSAIDGSYDDYERNASSPHGSNSSSTQGPKFPTDFASNGSRSNSPSPLTPPHRFSKGGVRSGSLSTPQTLQRPKLVVSKSSGSINTAKVKTLGDMKASTEERIEVMRPLSPIKPLSPMGF